MDKLNSYLETQPNRMTDDSSRLRREIAYERLKDAIQHAELEPGEPLSETRLSKMLGISRTPVREALQQWSEMVGVEGVHKGLMTLDPEAARKIDPTNLRRSIRALEVIFHTGRLFSEQKKK